MVKPQQPELRRSDRGATSDDATKERLTAPQEAPGGSSLGQVPEANQPGHHPPVEQDKPSGSDFVAKMHALAQEDEYEAPDANELVLDLSEFDTTESDERADRVAELVTKPIAVAGTLLQKVRDRL